MCSANASQGRPELTPIQFGLSKKEKSSAGALQCGTDFRLFACFKACAVMCVSLFASVMWFMSLAGPKVEPVLGRGW